MGAQNCMVLKCPQEGRLRVILPPITIISINYCLWKASRNAPVKESPCQTPFMKELSMCEDHCKEKLLCGSVGSSYYRGRGVDILL